jgi:hypothetical protein
MNIVFKDLVATTGQKDALGNLRVSTVPSSAGLKFSPPPPITDIVMTDIQVTAAAFNADGDLIVHTAPAP